MSEVEVSNSRKAEVMFTTLFAVEELFDTADSTIVVTITMEDDQGNDLPPEAKTVNFRAAKLKHLKALTLLITGLMDGLGNEEIVTLLNYVSNKQQENLAAGGDAYALDTASLVREATGSVSVITQLLSGAAAVLPDYVSLFTNLTKEEVENMDPTEVILVAYGIFARNFSFFIQNGRQLYQALMVSVARRLQKQQKKASE